MSGKVTEKRAIGSGSEPSHTGTTLAPALGKLHLRMASWSGSKTTIDLLLKRSTSLLKPIFLEKKKQISKLC